MTAVFRRVEHGKWMPHEARFICISFIALFIIQFNSFYEFIYGTTNRLSPDYCTDVYMKIRNEQYEQYKRISKISGVGNYIKTMFSARVRDFRSLIALIYFNRFRFNRFRGQREKEYQRNTLVTQTGTT